MSRPSRRPLWVLPFFHTNLAPAMAALAADGCAPRLLLARDSRLGEGAPPATVLTPSSQTWSAVAAAVRAADPDLVIVRKSGALSRLAFRAALLQGRPTLGYDQRPFLDPRPLVDRIGGLFGGRPWRRFTPVHGLPGARGARPDPGAVYLPFPVPVADAAPAPREGPARILCVAKFAERRKAQHLLIEALARLAGERAFTLTLAGSTSLEIGTPDPAHRASLLAAGRDGPLAGRVSVKADLPFAAMSALYRDHDICVLPSLREPLGTAPLEAMGQGCAAFVSDQCGSAWYVEGARIAGLDVGAVFRAGSAETIAEALSPVLADRARLEALRRDAWDWARREFSPALFARRFHEI